ncbi:MAG TPA: DUF131 domain-containing protein [Candidatus Korarchaeota archaeon]|nr:DUF131 domain-containing protein [Candidatus Korarchaeota archaeon]
MESMGMKLSWISLGLTLMFLGFILIMAGMFCIFYHAWKHATTGIEGEEGKTEVKGGGIIMIGPIPIIFGTDMGSLKVLAIIAIFLVVLIVLLILLPNLWRLAL